MTRCRERVFNLRSFMRLAALSCLAAVACTQAQAPAAPQHGVTRGQGGVPIEYEVVSSGSPTLVFVHGWLCDRTFWRLQRDPLAGRAGVVLLDLGGHGGSGSDRTDWSIASFAEDVVAVLTVLDLRDVILVGHSMGGPVVAEAASRAVDRTRGIVGVDTYQYIGAGWLRGNGVANLVAPLEQDFQATATRWIRGMFTDSSDAALVRGILDRMLAGPPAVGIPATRSLFEWYRDRAVLVLNELNIPVVTINSGAYVGTDKERLATLVPDLEVTIMDGVGHFPMIEAPAEFNRLLAETVTAMSRAPSRAGRGRSR